MSEKNINNNVIWMNNKEYFCVSSNSNWYRKGGFYKCERKDNKYYVVSFDGYSDPVKTVNAKFIRADRLHLRVVK